MNNDQNKRRNFLKKSLISGIALSSIGTSLINPTLAKSASMKLGLVTYLWGKDWSLPELISNCEKAGYEGLELRTQHAHGVETRLNEKERREVKKRFENSSVTCVGYGSNYEYHSPNPNELEANIKGTKEYIRLCHDIGASGIKVKPNRLPEEVSREKTIAQIAKSFSEVGEYAKDYGQLVRVEVHGKVTQQLPVMKAIFDQVSSSNVKICWNSNNTDLMEPGLVGNFNMVKKWLGDTTHIRAFDENDYPFQALLQLLHQAEYNGWILIESHSDPEDKLAAMVAQKETFDKYLKNL
ncbi:sugar phosphate isomerase/epimerase family protein [Cyclobacterium marinum]|uniref:Xylose isomerase domain-containing protein TIM barrel n=1 Tax=Cyclobacterium marinum (strain ATCC 25205 / DSM 745 / LMG 13164 / NCIMB 1802) TaxID=880070 RepID=G0J8F2_CYCMS|nr:sugar phosphate isomerase/epimerase family protein [Cyclobacterium marinum]AEL28752.1 Xylose isomerase domain-containing protein TIM barrel [Cyclobacterium marinum DSM 745]